MGSPRRNPRQKNRVKSVDLSGHGDNTEPSLAGNGEEGVETVEAGQTAQRQSSGERSPLENPAPTGSVEHRVKSQSELHGDVQSAGESAAPPASCSYEAGSNNHASTASTRVPLVGNDQERKRVISGNLSSNGDNPEATTGGNAGGAVESGRKSETRSSDAATERSAAVSPPPDRATSHVTAKGMMRSDLHGDVETREETARAPAAAGGNSPATRATSSEDGARRRRGVDVVLNDGVKPGFARAEPGVAPKKERLMPKIVGTRERVHQPSK
jgi:hypothetical protein